jgi:hypothetical protein
VWRTASDPANTLVPAELVGPAEVDDLAHAERDEVDLGGIGRTRSSSERSSVRHRAAPARRRVSADVAQVAGCPRTGGGERAVGGHRPQGIGRDRRQADARES